MKFFFAVTLITLGFCTSAHAEIAIPELPVFKASDIYSTSAAEPVTTDSPTLKAQGKFCCYQSHGGGFCELSSYGNVGNPCKCDLGGNASVYGRVCR